MSDSGNSVLIVIDTEAELTAIIKKLDTMHEKAPSILKNSINAAARKVRTQMIKDAQGRYAVKNKSILKKESEGGPRLFTASVANLSAEIKSKGPMQDIMAFLTKPNTESGAAAAKVLNSGAYKPLEVSGLKAFVTKFQSGHQAIVQRKSGPRLPIKKLLSPAVPHMLGNEEIRGRAEETAYTILQQEIQKRLDKINDTSTW